MCLRMLSHLREYRIYQIYSDGSDIQIGTVDGTESTYEVTGLKPDTSYTYAIKAYKEGKKGDAISGESVFSEKLIVTTLPEKMGTVTITNGSEEKKVVNGRRLTEQNPVSLHLMILQKQIIIQNIAVFSA